MALPLASIAANYGKKLIFDFLTEPEKVVKYIFLLILILVALVTLFLLPIMLIFSIPSLLLSGFGTSADSIEIQKLQKETLALYQSAPIKVNNSVLDWVNSKKKENSYDDVVTNINFSLSWRELLAVDTVRYKQEYKNVSEKSVMELANKFITKNTYKENYQVEESYEEEEEYTQVVVEIDEYGNTVKTFIPSKRTVTKTRMITKTRLVISVVTKTFEDIINELAITGENKEIALNMYSNIKNMDIEGNLNIYDDIDLSKLAEYPPGSANIPYFNQADKRWGTEMYGKSGTIMTSGCGPTALAMVVVGLTGKLDINPKIVADWSAENGYRAEGNGSYWTLMTEGANHWGIKVTQISRKDPKTIVKSLSQGKPIIASMGPGHFTNGGHYIVLRGIDQNGDILVYDPSSLNRSNISWSLATIISESSTIGGANGSPFWVYEK